MPFRNASAYNDYDYTGFGSPGAFPFNYDLASNQFISPYGVPLVSPQDSWTPNSQNQGSHSDGFSPLEMSYARSTPGLSGTVNQDAADSLSSPDIVRQSEDLQSLTVEPATLQNYELRQAGQKRSASHFTEGQSTTQLSPTTESRRQAMKSGVSPEDPVNVNDSRIAPSDDPRSHGEKSELSQPRATDSAKIRHNIVERRYRDNINAQVDVLRDSIVATMQVKDEQQGTSSSYLGADELKRLTKAAVIAAATQQIKRARSNNEKLLEEHRALQAQIQNLESQVKCGDCPLMQLTFDMGLENPTQQPP